MKESKILFHLGAKMQKKTEKMVLSISYKLKFYIFILKNFMFYKIIISSLLKYNYVTLIHHVSLILIF